MSSIQRAVKGHGTVTMEYLGYAMQRKPYFIQDIITRLYTNYTPFQSALQAIGGANATPKIIPAGIYRWQGRANRAEPLRILRAGGDFTVNVSGSWIVLDDGKLYDNAKIRFSDGTVGQLFQRRQDGDGYKYDVQMVGRPTDRPTREWAREAQSEVEYLTASYAEGSEQSHPIFWSTPNEFANIMEISRHHTDITGSALTEQIMGGDIKVLGKKVKDSVTGEDAMFYGYLPDIKRKGGESLIGFHLATLDMNMLHGRGNFNFNTGEIYNRDSQGRPVPTMEGVNAQLDGAQNIGFSLDDNLFSIKQQYNQILSHMADQRGQDMIDVYAFGKPAARHLWNQVVKTEFANNGQTVINMASGEVKIAKAGYGHIDSYETDFGKINFVTIGKGTLNESISATQTFNGHTAPVEDWATTFMPVKHDGDGLSVEILAKGENVGGKMVDRSLLLGRLPGMSGSDVNGSAYNAISTSRDGDRFEVLSERGVKLSNPQDCARLTPWPVK